MSAINTILNNRKKIIFNVSVYVYSNTYTHTQTNKQALIAIVFTPLFFNIYCNLSITDHFVWEMYSPKISEIYLTQRTLTPYYSCVNHFSLTCYYFFCQSTDISIRQCNSIL